MNNRTLSITTHDCVNKVINKGSMDELLTVRLQVIVEMKAQFDLERSYKRLRSRT